MNDVSEMGATPAYTKAAPTDNYEYKDNDSLTMQQDATVEVYNDLVSLVSNPTAPQPDSSETGMLRIKTANQWTAEAANRPNPKPLWYTLWYQGECCCLFADSNLGKSILAVQIADTIAKSGQKVIYFDFELSDKQFQIRYSDEQGNRYQFPENLLRSEIDPDLIGEGNFEDAVISDIEAAAMQYDCRVLIVDNITYLNSVTEKSDAASSLMLRLMQLKRKYSLSMLILAHTPKRPLSSPITQNDLAGSKKLFNFFDSAFAIGKSGKDEGLRYIKQLKCRFGDFEYSADNVLVAEIVKENGFLHFNVIGTAAEREHLKEQTELDVYDLEDKVREMRSCCKSVREIAETLGISKSQAGRIAKKLEV